MTPTQGKDTTTMHPSTTTITITEAIREALASLEIGDAVTADAYQKAALDTAIYPGQGTFWGLQYATTGLGNEAGEVQGVIKKMQRDRGYAPGDTFIRDAERNQLLDELGDVLWYIAVSAYEAHLPLSQVMEHNVAKLAKRKADNTINANNR